MASIPWKTTGGLWPHPLDSLPYVGRSTGGRASHGRTYRSTLTRPYGAPYSPRERVILRSAPMPGEGSAARCIRTAPDSLPHLSEIPDLGRTRPPNPRSTRFCRASSGSCPSLRTMAPGGPALDPKSWATIPRRRGTQGRQGARRSPRRQRSATLRWSSCPCWSRWREGCVDDASHRVHGGELPTNPSTPCGIGSPRRRKRRTHGQG